jgi:hypothetical protein
MTLPTLTFGSDTFNEISPGVYIKTGLTVDDAYLGLKTKPGALNKGKQFRTIGVTSYKDIDVTENGDTVRKRVIFSVLGTIPIGVSSTEFLPVLSLVASALADVDNAEHLILGGS